MAFRTFRTPATLCHPGAAQRNPGTRYTGFAKFCAVGGSGFRVRLRRPGMTPAVICDRPAWKERGPARRLSLSRHASATEPFRRRGCDYLNTWIIAGVRITTNSTGRKNRIIGTVKSRVSRARGRLAELLGYDEEDLSSDRLIQSAMPKD